MRIKDNFVPIVKIDQVCEGQRWVIPDIHGCVATFKQLVKQEIQLKKEDHLYLLGDYIDRGVDSGGVLDFILDLQAEAYQVFPLRGNHEEMFLEAYEDYQGKPRLFTSLLRIQKCRRMIDELGEVPKRYIDFMYALPVCYELADYYLVHAGFNFKDGKPFEDYMAMIWLRGFKPDEALLGGKRVLHGHVATSLETIQERIQNQAMVIPLDNGCVYRYRKRRSQEKGLGNLCAFNLDSQALKVLENIDDDPSMRPPPFSVS